MKHLYVFKRLILKYCHHTDVLMKSFDIHQKVNCFLIWKLDVTRGILATTAALIGDTPSLRRLDNYKVMSVSKFL